MSMDGVTKVIDWMSKSAPSKLFWSIVLVAYTFLLFEQFSDHFRLVRLTKIAALIESVSPGATQVEMQHELTKETENLLLPKQASPWWIRGVCGAAPFLFLLIAYLFPELQLWDFLKIFVIAILAGILIALIPDFLPKWPHCLGASLIYVVGVGLSINDELRKPM